MMQGIKPIFWGLLFFAALPTLCLSSGRSDGGEIQVHAEFIYMAGEKDARILARTLAVFGARRKAVRLAAKYLTHRGLLEPYGDRQREIFCLAADEISAEVVGERFDPQKREYFVRLDAAVRSTDFIKAEIKNRELEEKEMHLSYREEMGQFVSGEIDPARELARAYRHIRKKRWRMAIIYLDHLAQKYPAWGEVALAKAIGFFGTGEIGKATEALKSACALGCQEACEDLRGLDPHPAKTFR